MKEPTHKPKAAGDSPSRRSLTVPVALTLVVVAGIAIAVWNKKSGEATMKPVETPVVGVVKVSRENLSELVTIPAEFRPYVEVELHAKVSGYVDQMNVDFGDKVKNGQLLATLEVPELQDQLRNAIAMQQKAEADYTNAHQIFERLTAVNQQHPNLVAQQDLDNAQAKETSSAAAIAGAKAEVERYQTLVKYTRITAPFDGVVTKRYADPGALIQAGVTSSAQPLLRVSDNYHLRLDFPVSVAYVKDIHLGDAVRAKVESLNGKEFDGKVARYTGRVNDETRTMTVEVEVENPDLEIIPGMYAAVELKVNPRPNTLAVPIGAVSGSKNPTVYVVNDKSEIESRPVTLGIESPDRFEILSGLKEGEQVMLGSHSSVLPGQKVETKHVEPMKMP